MNTKEKQDLKQCCSELHAITLDFLSTAPFLNNECALAGATGATKIGGQRTSKKIRHNP